ncbi:hypothetical protein D3C78_1282720 [compost metagenome]
MLENTVSVTKTALFCGQAARFSGRQFDAVDIVTNMFKFNAISTNILNGGRAYAARNQRQVFQPCHPFFKGELHQFMPVFPRPYMQVPALIRFTNLNAHNAVNNDCAGKIIKEKDVTSFTQDQHRLIIFSRRVPRIKKLVSIIGTYNVIGNSLNTKGIPGLKVMIHRRYPDAISAIVYRICESIGD